MKFLKKYHQIRREIFCEMAGGLPKGLRAKGLGKKRQKNFRQSAQPNQDGPQSVSNQSDNFSTLQWELLLRKSHRICCTNFSALASY